MGFAWRPNSQDRGLWKLMISERLRKDVDEIWNRIFNHPFILEIYSGKLPDKKFKFYLLQDYSYLIKIIKAMTIIASKSNFEMMKEILEIAEMESETEIKNYEKILKKVGLSMEDAIKTKPSPSNFAYTNFIISTCSLGNEYEGLASILPCFWSYLEIAEKNKHLLEENKNEIYIEWAEEYLTNEYKELVEKMKSLLDKSNEYDKIKKIFVTSSKYEYIFWDMAYNMEEWKI